MMWACAKGTLVFTCPFGPGRNMGRVDQAPELLQVASPPIVQDRLTEMIGIFFPVRKGYASSTRLRIKPTPTVYWSPAGMIRTAWTDRRLLDAEGVRWQSRQLGYQP
jgi:hypothetical protein